ncbi:MAG: hypothetical protein ACREHD_00355 [Pirellulales bacterium]
MDVLKQQVRRARRRLVLQRFLSVLSWSWSAWLLAASIVVTVDKFLPLGLLAWVWPVAALACGLLTALIWCYVTRRSELEAALEIDRRFGLKERVSSTYALAPEQLESPAGRALVEDAMKRVQRLHVADQFRVRLGRWSWLPLLPGLAVFLIALFLQPAVNQNKAGGSTATSAEKKQVKTSLSPVRKKALEQRKQARDKGLLDAEQLFAKLEQGAKKLTEGELADKKQALVELNDLAQDLEKRRQQVSAAEKLAEQFKQLKDFEKGPADKMVDALKNGDFQVALKEMKQLRDKLENGKLDADAKAALEKQLKQMEDKLRKMADAHEKAQQNLKKQIEELKKKGQNQQAKELEEKLAQMQQQKSQMQLAKQLADQLGQCSKCMQQGDKAGAAKAMSKLEQQMADLQQEADEMAMLDEAMSELEMAKDSMNCKECGGEGCQACMGRGQGRFPGMGLGRGRGNGPRPEEKTGSQFYDSKVKQQTGKGAALVVDSVDGPNIKGQVEQQIQTEFESVKSGETDPLTSQQLPRGYREHTQKYFDSLRDDK